MKKQLLLLTLILFPIFLFAATPVKAPKGKIISFISYENFSEKEYFETKKVFEKAGYEVVTVANTKAKIEGVAYASVRPDLALKDITYCTDYSALVVIGGEGAVLNVWNNTQLLRLIKNFDGDGKVTAGISLAPVALGQAGVLVGKKAAVNKKFGAPEMLKATGAIYVKSGVVTSDFCVTAADTKDAVKFAKAVLALIKKTKKEK